MTYPCPKGHASADADYCDTCGARIAVPSVSVPSSAAAAPAAFAAPAVPSPGGPAPCPHCQAPRAGSGRFCEDCGFDFHTGKIPDLGGAVPSGAGPVDVAPAGPTAAGPAAASAGSWTATVAADREYFEANAIEGVEFPATGFTRTVPVSPPQIRIGRRSSATGAAPEIDLRDDDPGVSHHHALLTLSVDGVWLLSDLGSTNGTYVNDEPSPLTTGQSRALTPGDRVHVGAWTTITLQAP